MLINVAASAIHSATEGVPPTEQRASRRSVSLPPAAFTLCANDACDTVARRLSTPLETLRNNLSAQGAHTPGEARALAGAQQLVSAADTLMAELVAHEHARQQADAVADTAQEEQAKNFARLDELTRRYA